MRRLISIILCILIIASLCISVAASTNTNYAGGNNQIYISLEDQIENLLSNPSLSFEQRQRILEKYDRAVQAMTNPLSARNISVTTRSATTLFIPFCPQELYYYCGPATVQQTYYYLNRKINNMNSAPSQTVLASALHTTQDDGTDLTYMVNYLNNTFNLDYVILWWWASPASMADCIHQAIDEDERPTMLHISIDSTYGTNWKYETDGHYVNIEGYTANGLYTIVDPYLDGHNISTGRYNVTIDDLFAGEERMAY